MAAKKRKAPKASRPVKKVAAAKKKAPAKKSAAKKKVNKKAVKKTAAKKPVMKKAAKRVTKQAVKKVAAKKPARKQAAKHPAPQPAAQPAAVPRVTTPRLPWVDVLSQTPLIDDHARQLESFITAMADGRVDEGEVKQQEQRVVSLLQEIDPQLDNEIHAKVTRLLCELTAYDMMQMLYAMEQARPKTFFQG